MSAIVITGARGYVGTALVRRLASEGRRLRLVSRAASAPADGSAMLEHVQADLRDETSWAALLQDAVAVVHLSSRTDLRAAEADSAGDDALNVAPVRALVRAAERRGGALPVVFASTVTIVGAMHANPVDEQMPDNPCSVYDRHKRDCETILRDATHRGVLRACSLRLSNVYGAGTTSINANRGLLNSIMRRAGQGEDLTVYGDGACIRDFTFLGDVVDAFFRALEQEHTRDGAHYVIASGRGHTLLDAFEMVAQAAFLRTGRRVAIRHVPEPADLHAIERRDFVGDARLFQTLTGWQPQVDLASGIRDYYETMNDAAPGAQSGRVPNAAA